jgi:sugar phosphate isomerase/epimerase
MDARDVWVILFLGYLLIEGQEDYLTAFELLGEYLAHIHVKNAVWVRRDETDASGAAVFQNEWAPLQSGQGSVLEYFKALAAHGYDGWVTVEDFSTELPLAERTAANLDYLRRTAALAGLTAGAGAR